MIQFLSNESQRTEIKRICPHQEGKIKTTVFTLSNKIHGRLRLLCISKLKVYKKNFLSKELNAEEAKQEQVMLKFSRDLIGYSEK